MQSVYENIINLFSGFSTCFSQIDVLRHVKIPDNLCKVFEHSVKECVTQFLCMAITYTNFLRGF